MLLLVAAVVIVAFVRNIAPFFSVFKFDQLEKYFACKGWFTSQKEYPQWTLNEIGIFEIKNYNF